MGGGRVTNLATLGYCALYAALFLTVVVGLAVVILAVITVLRTPADFNDVEDDEPRPGRRVI